MDKVILLLILISLVKFNYSQSSSIKVKELIEVVSKEKVTIDSIVYGSHLITGNKFIRDSISREDIEYLLPLIYSKQKCGCLIDKISSLGPIKNDYAELGGYASAIIDFYENGADIQRKLVWCPKVDVELNSQFLTPELEYNSNSFNKINLDSLWNDLLFNSGGCLTGGQYVFNGKFGGEGCVMSRSKKWKDFFSEDKENLMKFLITKISDNKINTKIHTCPFSNATEAEIAVYALQKITSINWYDFDEFIKFKSKQSESDSENHQTWLQNIISNNKQRNILIKCWTEKVDEN